jgi:hypothetical protein
MAHAAFEVNKKGFAMVYGQKPLHRAVEELISNAQDEDEVSKVTVTIEHKEGRHYEVSVEDDSPKGFRDISEIYTLFTPSYKKDNPNKNGRYGFGEKWVIAKFKEAKIITTKGGVSFVGEERHMLRTQREIGTLFTGTVVSTKEEIDRTIRKLMLIIPNEKNTLSINGEIIQNRKPICTFKATLPTVGTNDNGDLITKDRETTINVFEVLADEEAYIFELGIPIVKTGDIYHYDVRQKVPLSLDRDNVKPSYLRKLRTLVLDHTCHLIPADKAAKTCIREALANASPEAINTILTKQFGEKRAVFDPSDTEANNRLTADGYKVISGGTFDKEIWDRIKEVGAVLPSGVIRPTPGKNSTGLAKHLDPKKKTTEMEMVETYAKMIAHEVLGKNISVSWYNDLAASWAMSWNGNLAINVARLGYTWFERPPISFPITDLLIHEFAHEYCDNHLDEDYYKALSKIGGKLVELALRKPELFKEFM